MVLGDTHGNADWLRHYVFPTAVALGVDRIVQCGDFGYWEHQPAGVQFLDEVSRLATVSEIPLYWLRGNHDKSSLVHERYGGLRDNDGFLYVRDNVLFIPDGTLWRWQGRSFRAFGGAYSVDKAWRLQQEQLNYEYLLRKEERLASKQNREPAYVAPQTGMLWFPEEEMSDKQMDDLLAVNSERLDFVLSHDKPRCTNPGWNRKDLPGCLPNQDRLQRALLAHRPSYWFHGHLHHHYVQPTMSSDTTVTTVVSLDPDDGAAEPNWMPQHAWCLIELAAEDTVILGEQAYPGIDEKRQVKAKRLLSCV